MVNISDQVILAFIGSFIAVSSTIVGAYVTIKKSQIEHPVEENTPEEESDKKINVTIDEDSLKRVDKLNRSVEELSETNARLAKSIDKHREVIDNINNEKLQNSRRSSLIR